MAIPEKNMVNIERVCKRNGTEDVLFYPYGILGEQEEVVDCIHKPRKEEGNIRPEQEIKAKPRNKQVVLKKYYLVE